MPPEQTWRVHLEADPNTDGAVVVIPDAVLTHMDWHIGDAMEIGIFPDTTGSVYCVALRRAPNPPGDATPASGIFDDAVALLGRLIADCEGPYAHRWRDCPRCRAVHGIDQRFPKSMALLTVAHGALLRTTRPTTSAPAAPADSTATPVPPSEPPRRS